MNQLKDLLSGKKVVIIGGAGLIGRTFAKGILDYGGEVIVADINYAECLRVRESILDVRGSSPVNINAEQVDITSKKSINDLVARVVERSHSIDAVVNCAYPKNQNYGRKLVDVEFEDFCENLNMHLGGYFLSTQCFAKYFASQGFGQVVNISSIYGSIAPRFDIYEGTSMTMPVEYAAIKSAIQHLSVYFMRYYKGTKLRFNCISPGGIFDDQPKSFLNRYKNYAQSKEILDSEDILGALIFLLSNLSQYVNGQNIVVDDGWSA